MKKRRYTHNQIKAIATQQALRAITMAERHGLFLDPEFVLDTRYDSPTRDEYPYRTEVMVEMNNIEQQLRNRIARLVK